jgi:hypothetical protein
MGETDRTLLFIHHSTEEAFNTEELSVGRTFVLLQCTFLRAVSVVSVASVTGDFFPSFHA